jgi:hypothetical protein
VLPPLGIRAGPIAADSVLDVTMARSALVGFVF